MNILVTGGRDYIDKERVYYALDYLHTERGITCIIQGGARGADRLAKQWAIDRGIPFENEPAPVQEGLITIWGI